MVKFSGYNGGEDRCAVQAQLRLWRRSCILSTMYGAGCTAQHNHVYGEGRLGDPPLGGPFRAASVPTQVYAIRRAGNVSRLEGRC